MLSLESFHFPQHPTLSYISGHLRYDYLIKYAYFVKRYLNWFASVRDPEKWIANVAQWKNT